jgi:adenylate cyclase
LTHKLYNKITAYLEGKIAIWILKLKYRRESRFLYIGTPLALFVMGLLIFGEKEQINKMLPFSISILLIVAVYFFNKTEKDNIIIKKQKEEIEREKERSEKLLLNILPAEVAEELKLKGSANAKHFDAVTVMFTDFKHFTKISETLSPTELVAEIHTCFEAFDNITTRHNLEKIKTIGDSYMCAGGLPVPNDTNAIDMVSAALEIQEFMKQHLAQRRSENRESFEIRIGIHTGPVVAGIVGVKKFAYDIWGDTVNIASRMESGGEEGKVNISRSTYELVRDKFKCEYRGKIEAKNKGTIDMYFVNGSLGEH